MIGEQVHMCFNCYRHSVGAFEMGRHAARHDEKWVETDKDITSIIASKSRRLSIKRRYFSEVFIHETRRHEVIGRRRQAGCANISQMERREYLSLTRALQHFARRVNTVDYCHSFTRKPCGRSTRSTAQIGATLDSIPPDTLELLEQPKIHVMLYRVLVGFGPLSVTLLRPKSSIFSLIK